MTKKTQTDYVLERLGGLPEAVRITGIPEQTWRNWMRAGRIPQQRHLPILLNARAEDRPLTPADFYAHLFDRLLDHTLKRSKEAPGDGPDADG